MKLLVVTALFALFLTAEASAQSFSCSFGTRAACLDYGDTVCSSLGKCVSSDAVCFERYQCGFEGFTCKSSVTECVEEHNALVRDFNMLRANHEDLLKLAEEQRDQLQSLKFCIEYATTLEEAHRCNY